MMSKLKNFRCFCSAIATPFVQTFEQGSCGVVILNRPKEINAFTKEMSHSIYSSLKSFESDEASHVVIKGAGGRFSIGRDMRDILDNPWEYSKDRFQHEFQSFHLISNFKKPVVVILDGVTFGGACIYAMGAKYRVATERSLVSMLETSVGFSGASGSSYYLSRLRKNVGIYMALTGYRMRGFDLKKVGLASHFIETKKLKMLENDLLKIKNSNEIQRVLAIHSDTPMTFETEFDRILPKVEKCFDASSVDEIYENLKKDGSKWAKDTIKILNSKSPTSLKVCHRQMYLGKMLKLTDCLKMEYRIALQHIIDSDLHEGCRAILYDKDDKPKWKPQKLEDVTKEQVERFFSPLPDNHEIEF